MISTAGSVRCAFVMEQTLGHVTHTRNLRDVIAGQRDVSPVWLPVPFAPSGLGRFMPLFRSNWSVRASWRARRMVQSALRTGALDAVLFHTQVTALFSTDIMSRVPSIVSLDATPINYDSFGHHYGHRPAGDGLMDRKKWAMNRRVFQSASRLVTWSRWARASLDNDYGIDPASVCVLAPGANEAFFDVGRRRIARQSTERTTNRLPRLLFVGGDFQRKGGSFLLDCMRGPLGERCELHVVTGAEIAPQRGVHVHRGLGPNDPALLQLFADADIFVLPSLADCLAVVLMEATAAALPVITTDVGALAEAVYPGESGLLVKAGDSADLGRALDVLVDDAEARERMGRAGQLLAGQIFDARKNGRALLNIMTEAALQGRQRWSAA